MTIQNSRFFTLATKLLLALILSSLTLPFFPKVPAATAQTDEPDWGDIRSIGAFVALPTMVSFRVRMIDLTNDQMARVTLTIQQNDETIHQVDLDLDNSILYDFITEVEYEYNWVDLSREPLQLFQPLYYEFEVETVEGVISNAGEEIQSEHQGVGQWQMTEDERVTLRYYNPRLSAGRHAETLNAVLDLFSANIGFEESIDMVVYSADTSLCFEQLNEETGQTESVVISDGRPFPCSVDELHALYENNGMILAVVDDTSFNTTANGLAWVLVDTIYSEYWGDAEVPAWFKRGLELYYSPSGFPTAITAVQRAAQQDRLLRLSEMAAPLSETATLAEVELWEGQAYMLTLYLAENYGAAAPFQIAAALTEDVSFLDALADVADVPLERIFSAWTLWVNTARAEQVSLWNPYQDTTPTPTATFTPSQIPPTRTPTATFTVSMTPSDTPAFIPPTERIRPQTLTFTPTASNTPLPPGAFDNPTPIASTSNEDGSGGLCGTGIGAFILPVVGLILVRRRRAN